MGNPKKSFNIVKRGLIITGTGIVAAATVVALAAAKYEPVFAPNTFVGEVAVGGLTPQAATQKIKAWWGARQMDLLTFSAPQLYAKFPDRKPAEAGLELDIEASLKQVSPDDFGESVGHKIGLNDKSAKAPFVFHMNPAKLAEWKAAVARYAKPVAPACVTYEKGAILLHKERGGIGLDESKLQQALVDATMGDGKVVLPLMEGVKRIPDEELAKIKEVMMTFTTHFPARQADRNNNIRTASGKINGTILMPGEVFSFNTTVGKRTIDNGFREAGVYKNGRHDRGVGGGICQVSTTLYNCALLSNMQIVERRNHSLPVAYVPLGRDATVDFGSIDFRFKNIYSTPIAISAEFVPGSLTFRLLGVKDPSLKVEIIGGPVKSWANGMKMVKDPSLPAGKQVVEDKGGSGRSVYTWRLVYRNGKLEKKEPLGQSLYPGAPALVRVGTRAVANKIASPAAPAAAAPPTGADPAP